MKFTVTALALMASVAMAAPAAEAEPWCERPGQSCWKREAEPEAWCERPGQSCWKAKREAEPWCERPGQSCWKKRTAEADAWCERPGQSCWKVKRAAEALDLEAREPEAWCELYPRGDCWKAKRAIEGLSDAVTKRSHQGGWGYGDFYHGFEEDEPEEADTEEKRWCERPGQSCWKAKRAADAVLDIVEREAEAWCERPGQSCWKREAEAEANPEAEAWCERPGQSCWKAKRELENIQLAARGVFEVLL